jgi:gliding motility-associated-like protein
MAANNKIYLACDRKPYLGVIQAPDFKECRFEERGASLFDPVTGFKGWSGFGLPNISSSFLTEKILYTGTCQGDTTTFYLSSTELFDNAPIWYINGAAIQADLTTYMAEYVFSAPFADSVKVEGSKSGKKVTLRRFIHIHPLPAPEINDTTYLCAGQPVELHDGNYPFYGITNEAGTYMDSVKSIDQAGLYRVTVTNIQGCSRTINTRALAIDSPEIDTIIVNRVPCTGAETGSIRILMKGNLDDYNFLWADDARDTNIRENLKPGDYKVTISLNNGCSLDTVITVEKTTLDIKITRLPDQPDTVCPRDEIILTATGAGSFEWAHAPGVFQNQVTVRPVGDTTYYVTGSDGNQCFGYDSIRIAVFENYELNLGEDITTCLGDTVVLRGKDYDPWSAYREWNWSLPNEKSDSIVVVNSIDNLQLRVRDLNGCYYTDDIAITFQNSLKLVIKSSVPLTSPVCPGTKISLTVTGADKVNWEHAPADTSKFITVTVVRDTVFRVFGSNNGSCSGTGSINILVYDEYLLDLGADRVACEGDTIVIGKSDYDPESVFKDWYWSNDINTDSLVAYSSIPGLTLMVNDINGCPHEDEINITFNPLPVITSVVKQDISCHGEGDGSMEIFTEGVQTQYEYSIDEGKYWSVQNIFRNVDAGNYTVQVRSGAGCLSLTSQATILEPDSLAYVIRSVAPTCPECTDGEISISVSGGTSPYSYDWHGYNVYDSVFTGIGAGIYPITISDINGCDINLDYPLTAGELFIPNAFSPNGGNRNEKWIIKILENRPDCLVQVYDRSGKLVFYSDNNYQPWDGTYLNQGGELPAGTYFYRIQIDRNDENKPPQLGTVTILR